MSRPKLSIKVLMGYIASTAILLVAVARPDAGWITFLFVFHCVLLLTSILGSLYRRGLQRAFWVGFALFGLTSFLVGSLAAGSTREYGGLYYFANVVGISLNELISYLILKQQPVPYRSFQWFLRPGDADLPTRMIAFSMVMAFLGGQIARTMARSGQSEPASTTPDGSQSLVTPSSGC